VAEAEVASAHEDGGVSRARQLARAQGFGVETTSGRIGRVAAVVPPRASGAGVLLVHGGGRSCALTAVPFEDVADVDFGSCRITLSGPAQGASAHGGEVALGEARRLPRRPPER
jgi:hypothetical protein